MDCINLINDSSLVRVLNASTESIPVDIYINDKLVFRNIDFKNFSKYVRLEEGEYRVDVYQANDNQTSLIKQKIHIEPLEVYTIAIIGENDNLSLLVINDYSSKTISDDYSSFRIINLSPESGPVDIVVDSDILFKSIGYKEGTIYADVKIDEYDIKIVRNSDSKPVLKSRMKFKPNRIYTIYIIGNPPTIAILQSVDGNTYLCR